jgi:hypothetical protein
MNFTVDRNEYNMEYYLSDDIYPLWLVLMKGVPLSQAEKHQFFTQKQALLGSIY